MVLWKSPVLILWLDFTAVYFSGVRLFHANISVFFCSLRRQNSLLRSDCQSQTGCWCLAPLVAATSVTSILIHSAVCHFHPSPHKGLSPCHLFTSLSLLSLNLTPDYFFNNNTFVFSGSHSPSLQSLIWTHSSHSNDLCFISFSSLISAWIPYDPNQQVRSGKTMTHKVCLKKLFFFFFILAKNLYSWRR